MTTKLTLTNQPGDAPYSGLTFNAYIVEQGEMLRYGREAERRTVEIFDARHPKPVGDPEREGQFVADYYAETLLADRERLANGLNLYGGEASWTLDDEAVAGLLDALI